MRRDGIPYVSSGVYNPPFPAVPLQDMTLEEIKKKYLSMCAKANGDPAVCSKCPTPCAEGKRAVQLVANRVYNDPPIPLYGGKTLIEKAREENMLRRQRLEEEKKAEEKTQVAESKRRQDPKGWYEASLLAKDQIQFVMDMFHMTKAQARKKIYSYRYRNGLTDKTYKTKNRNKPVVEPAAEVQQTIVTQVPVVKIKDDSDSDRIESKIDSLMKQQAEYKQEMDKCYKAYMQAKEVYESFSKKIDILCSAIDIINE